MRVTDEWNNLTDSVKDARNVPYFKRLLRRHKEGAMAPAAHHA